MAATVNTNRVRQDIQQFAFGPLFIEELGWDALRMPPQLVMVGVETYTLRPVAQKRGFQVFACDPDVNGGIPDYATRKQIDARAASLAREHLIIYADSRHAQQVWQWTRREQGKPTRTREQHFLDGQPAERLTQRLRDIAFGIEEEETLSLLGVAARVQNAFDVDRTTKRFYDRFKDEHSVFLKAIGGIKDEEQREWYASLSLNRLMFVYFIQKKGFIDQDPHYLRNRLKMVQALYGEGRFHSFFRDFLLRLFHQGLGTSANERPSDFAAIFGEVPYVNGGLFEEHQIEQSNPQIAITDEAFERVFDFFDAYDWHLDDRPLGNDREINPDVLGYIFEKYINQKQMGAYYTKEDITGYISRNTIIPWLFETARKDCKIAFEAGGEVWRLLSDDPDRYIYDAVRKGIDEPLPEEIAAGVDDVSKRGGWNRPAIEPFALPTETWREHVARRQRALDLRAKLEAGETHEINDLITYNLDIERFAQDVIERCEGPELLRAFWKALTSITVLDPTCGSGAFLFATLSILEKLYEAALDRMRAFVADYERLGRLEFGETFRKILLDVSRHPNPRYFILKTIIVNNLYGVDIMEEAVEIAKLRFFLKLVAQVEDSRHIEPLPDIDFNIRAGNTLVGFATLDAVREAMAYGPGGQMKMLSVEDEATLARINERAEIAGRAFDTFRRMQSEHGMSARDFHDAKRDLQQRLDGLRGELDRYLAREYGVDPDDMFAYNPWCESHRPFHWFVEFYGIVHEHGGFDAIIGNPPYVEYKNVRDVYAVRGYRTEACGDLYAFVMERSQILLGPTGALGMIVPVSIASTDGFAGLRALLSEDSCQAWCLSFAERPSKLFNGVEKRLTVWVARKNQPALVLCVSNYRRWFSEERDNLFALTSFVVLDGAGDIVGTAIPKISTQLEARVLARLVRDRSVASYLVPNSKDIVYYTRKLRYFVQFFDFVPRITDATGKILKPSELKTLEFGSKKHKWAALAALNSNLFFWFFCTFSDVRNVNRREIEDFRCSLDSLAENQGGELDRLARSLMEDFNAKARFLTSNYGKYGVLTIQSFQPRLSKPIIDEIDRVLARHYGFTDEELDFIINYDIKYRMGQENGGDEAEEE